MTREELQQRIRSSFAKQGLMTTLGATLGNVSPGMVEIELRPNPAVSQQTNSSTPGPRAPSPTVRRAMTRSV